MGRDATGYDNDTLKILVFDEKTGAQKTYETFSTNEVWIQGDTFSLVTEKDKTFLWSQTSDHKIPLTEAFYSLKNTGKHYIIGQYIARPEPVADHKSSRKIKPVTFNRAKIIERSFDYAVLLCDTAPRILVKGSYTSCKPLYAYDERRENSMEVRVIDMEPEITGLLCSSNDNHTLYDKDMKKAGSFIEKASGLSDWESYLPDDEQVAGVLRKCSNLLHTPVVFNIPASIMMMAESRVHKEPPARPELTTEQTSEGTVVYAKGTNGISTRLFLTKYPVKTDNRSYEVDITPSGKVLKPVIFYVDMDRQKIMLPVKYVKMLQLKMY
ncbi:hypothetical protein ACTHGU_00590 [Chitinophagaceae bacterium MMS25-I14]